MLSDSSGEEIFHQIPKFLLDDFKKRLKNSKHLTSDSRLVREGSFFIAIKGLSVDGHDFIDSLLNVASVIIVSKEYNILNNVEKSNTLIIPVSDTVKFSSLFAPYFYNYPAEKMKIIGVTGTNGKTTITYLLEKIYNLLGKKTGVIGTINIRYGDRVVVSSNTTPEVIYLQEMLSDMLSMGVEVVIMEVSSHALVLNRISGIDFDSAIFTNLTPEHLDFHKDMDSYFKAKLKLFKLLKSSQKRERRAVYWQDMDYTNVLDDELNESDIFNLTFSDRADSSAAVKCHIIKRRLIGSDIILYYNGKNVYEGLLNQIGDYNILNMLSAICEVVPEKLDDNNFFENIINNGINRAIIPGRLERVDNDKGLLILVDYAHSPDALENALSTLKELPHRRLISLFGCGGDRDCSKRLVMGEISGRLADFTIVTSDNPRSEDPKKIIDEIIPGVEKSGGDYQVIFDREEAIKVALTKVDKDDILLVAGKGHEDYQILASGKIHFDDREVIQKYLS